ncbi:hypothetical protein AXG93_1154s1380 [Marchantia polymorpha subsp. ruderalis]|uniref:Uncharacterized protein n=1 Tax=Marchantia polymorpha subsp. ruderalis TaxID=1480154 RepID=A0A176WS66_MARPO|nr:hypothetical protein AXG93_1154s1380 [Marchantia polymorpha subsp. ruderalis]
MERSSDGSRIVVVVGDSPRITASQRPDTRPTPARAVANDKARGVAPGARRPPSRSETPRSQSQQQRMKPSKKRVLGVGSRFRSAQRASDRRCVIKLVIVVELGRRDLEACEVVRTGLDFGNRDRMPKQENFAEVQGKEGGMGSLQPKDNRRVEILMKEGREEFLEGGRDGDSLHECVAYDFVYNWPVRLFECFEFFKIFCFDRLISIIDKSTADGQKATPL